MTHAGGRAPWRALVGLPIPLAIPAGAQTSTTQTQGVFNAVEKKIVQYFFVKNNNSKVLVRPAGATAGQVAKAKMGKKGKGAAAGN